MSTLAANVGMKSNRDGMSQHRCLSVAVGVDTEHPMVPALWIIRLFIGDFLRIRIRINKRNYSDKIVQIERDLSEARL